MTIELTMEGTAMNTQEVTWQEFKGLNLAGREAVLCEKEGTTRGVVERFDSKMDGIQIRLQGSEAQIYDPETGEWSEEKVAFDGPHVGHGSTIRRQADDTITIGIPNVGRCYISPVGHSLVLPSAKIFA